MRARHRLSLLVLLLALPCWSASAARNETCDRLAAFENARFDDSVVPRGRRWVEMHWTGTWPGEEGWGLECRRSPDRASVDLCAWLIHNTSMEFMTNLPLRILTCHGARLPLGMTWSDWRSSISFWTRNRQQLLEIDFATEVPGESGAIRFSSFAEDQSDALVEMPPLYQRSTGARRTDR
jgi:hypothetical protein